MTARASRVVLAQRAPVTSRIVLANLAGTYSQGRSGALRVSPAGRMRVILNVHGGQQALADVLEGLVVRNMRALREQPDREQGWSHVKPADDTKVWRDIPTALRDGVANNGTRVVYEVARLRLAGRHVRVGFDRGLPAVVEPHQQPRAYAGPRYEYPVNSGRTDERMVLTIDDDKALPVREINQAIAVHNVGAIQRYKLGALYGGRIKYKVEGSPELWWDAKEIRDRTYDDCEGLVAYRVAELMLKGYDAEVYTRLIERPSKAMGGSGKGGRLFHAIVRVNSFQGEPVVDAQGLPVWDDPSMRLSMPVPAWYKKFAAEMRSKGRSL